MQDSILVTSFDPRSPHTAQHVALDVNQIHKKSCVQICLTKQDLFRTKALSVGNDYPTPQQSSDV